MQGLARNAHSKRVTRICVHVCVCARAAVYPGSDYKNLTEHLYIFSLINVLPQEWVSCLGFQTSPTGQRQGGGVRQKAVPQAQGQGARGQAWGKGHRPHPGTERGRDGVPKPGPRSVHPPPQVPCPRLGRMWWQLQEGGQDVGVGAAETEPDCRLPSSSLCPPIRPLQITCLALHRRTISSFPRKDIVDTAISSHQRLELCHAFL